MSCHFIHHEGHEAHEGVFFWSFLRPLRSLRLNLLDSEFAPSFILPSPNGGEKFFFGDPCTTMLTIFRSLRKFLWPKRLRIPRPYLRATN
jgi:hypothetical protein